MLWKFVVYNNGNESRRSSKEDREKGSAVAQAKWRSGSGRWALLRLFCRCREGLSIATAMRPPVVRLFGIGGFTPWGRKESYRAARARLADLHGHLANAVLALGDTFLQEDLSIRGRQRRFEKSVGFRAPGRFFGRIR